MIEPGVGAVPRTRPALKRSLSFTLLTLYGVGTTVGAGIYVLVGKVAGIAGMMAPLSFVLASALVAFSAFSFAELVSRFPFSAGEALYVREGTGSARLGLAVGLLVAIVGVISSATLALGFAGYLATVAPLPQWAACVGLFAVMGGIAAWGITQSALVAGAITIAEIGGLLVVVVAGAGAVGTLEARWPEMLPGADATAWIAILAGAVLAFYAFIGFEDMVNVAEEVVDVHRVLPRAIVATLIVTTVLYMAVATVAVLAVPVADLAASDAPIALLFERTTGRSALPLTLVALFSVVNGILIQLVMAARVLYGLSEQGWLPAAIGRVERRTRTPVVATALAVAAALALALFFPILALAKATAYMALAIFALVNGALCAIKCQPDRPPAPFRVPFWVPATGLATSLAILLFEGWRTL